MDNAGKLMRPNPRVPIIRIYMERKPVLADLVRILEINHNLPEENLKEWVKWNKIQDYFDTIYFTVYWIKVYFQNTVLHV